MIELIGVPFDYCGFRLGSRLGPPAVRLAGLARVLDSIGQPFRDAGDLEVAPEQSAEGGIRNFAPAVDLYRKLSDAVAATVETGHLPLVVGGDHSLAIGSVSGALRATGGDLAVLWIDAHTDLNTPQTSPSGNLHGMALGALLRLASLKSPPVDREWATLLQEVVPDPGLAPARVGWYSVRDVDAGERDIFHRLGAGYMATMYDIDRHGAVEMALRIDRWLRASGAGHLYISFDVDALDPILAPGTGTTVRGGLTYREMHVLGELIQELTRAADCPYRLVGLEIVEINPLFDTNNETARTAVEWIASLFGKTILGSR